MVSINLMIFYCHSHLQPKMGSATHCGCAAAPSSRLVLGLHRSTCTRTISGLAHRLSPISISSKSRSNAAVRLQIRRKLSTVFASNHSGGNSVEKTSGGTPQGPPLLTILAGATLFFLVFWIARSILTGLIGFLVSLIPFK